MFRYAHTILSLQELSTSFSSTTKPLLLSVAVSPARNTIDRSYDVPSMSRYVDFINVMSYDFHGAWERQTGHLSPLFKRPEDKLVI